jgi:23S rRNA pseudouridine1911/1915/1917 synthase
LDKFLATNFEDESRSQIQNWIRAGLVLINGEKKKNGYILELDDKIEIERPPKDKLNDLNIPEPLNLDIIYEDESLVVINKPAGLVVHPGVGNKTGTLVHGLLYHFNSLSSINGALRPGIVHRLDKDTSGAIIVAKTDFAHSHIARQFETREVKKVYTGLTWGSWKKKEGIIDNALARKRKDPTAYIVSKNGKPSVTKFKIEKQFRHLSLVSFYPKTGRTHQIRVHSSFLGYPIFGDEKYGGGIIKTKGFLPEFTKIYQKQLNLFKRHALHASAIEIKHPVKNKMMNFEASMPKELLNLIDSIKLLYE